MSRLAAILIAACMILASVPSGFAWAAEADSYAKVMPKTESVIAGSMKAEYGYEWQSIDLARNGKAVSKRYYIALADEVKNAKGSMEKPNNAYSYTNNAKAILALTAGGYDARNIHGYNLVSKLSDFEAVTAQGPNGAMYALLALDSAGYSLRINGEDARDVYVRSILDSRLEDGTWSYMGDSGDVDLTSIAIMALAPYRASNEDAGEAIDKAADWLASQMSDNGTFQSWGTYNSNSTASVIFGLSANGINPATDERFVRNGENPVSGMLSFALADGNFGYDSNTEANGYATEQCFQAMVSLKLLGSGKSMYVMRSKPDSLKKVTYSILSGVKASVSKVTPGKKLLKVTAAKESFATGYEIKCSTSSKFGKSSTKTVTSKSNTVTVKKLKAGKKYYVKVRALKKSGGKTYATAWSSVKSAKVK